MKIVLNNSYGGFGLSNKAISMILERKGIPFKQERYECSDFFTDANTGEVIDLVYDLERSDPDLVAVVEILEDEVNTDYSDLIVYDLPEGTHYQINEYDGFESLYLRDEMFWKVAT